MSVGGEEKIRVLIVDDVPETRENLRKLLYFESDIEVVAAATSGEEGIELAKQHQPHVVLMDINMPGMDGISASEAIIREVPFTQVIMMSVQGEADYLRRSMLAGASDFLTKPFTVDELVSAIRRVYEMGASRRRAMPVVQPEAMGGAGVAVAPQKPMVRGKVVVVFSPKGGVGCSTLAVNLAIALQKLFEEKRVALVDASLQFGDVGVLLNMQPTRSIVDIVQQVDEIDAELLDGVLLAHQSGVKVLLAPPSPEMAELVQPDHIQALLGEITRYYDYVVVDTPSHLQDSVLNAFDIADRIIVVATPDVPSIKDIRLYLGVTEALEYPPEKTMLVINKMDRRFGISVKLIEDNLKHPVVAQLPLDERTVIMAANQGIPLAMGDRRHPLTQAIFDLANKLVESLEAPEEEEEVDEQTRRRLGRVLD